MKKIILLMFLLTTPAKGFDLEKYYQEPLTKFDKKGILVFNVLQTIDMLQTLEIANNDAYYEKNPILGKHPNELHVVSYFIARGFAHYHVTKMIPQRYRNIWHGYNIVYNYDVIRDNHAIGIRIDF
tara:strand:+ start:3724 stop:4101 length:378 start_codon:yes stop_codon:yes gene_type:complete